jgi:cell division septum initiation protein DivIVA
MDILHLVDRLEEIFNAGTAIPLSHKLMVDEDRVLEIIDQMRVSIPEEVKKAQQVLAQRDRILAQAQEEAQRTVQLAKEKAEQVLSRDSLVQSAQGKAEQILQAARADAQTIRAEADDYTIEVLTKLEAELVRSLTQARNGIAKLRTERTDTEAETVAAPSD